MSLFSEYVKETKQMDIIEDEQGFVTFLVSGEDCYIADLFIRPQFRRKHKAFSFGDELKQIAKDKGCKNLVTTVNTTNVDPSTPLKGILAFGFKVISANNNIILAKMEL